MEGRIVVHLKLPVSLDPGASRRTIVEQRVEAGGEVRALVEQSWETGSAGLDMFGIRVGALGLQAHMEHLEGKDGKTVGHRSSRLRVQSGARFTLHGRQLAQDILIDLLDRVVALLIVRVDSSLVGGDRRIGNVPPPRLILLLPEQAVAPVVELN